MALAEVCRLRSNGKGGYEGFVRAVVQGATRRGGDRFFVPIGTRLTIWQLGAIHLDAYLLIGLEPDRDPREDEQLLCRLWRMKRGHGYTGKMTSSFPQKLHWKWELPKSLWFEAYLDKRRGDSEFGLKIQA